MTQLTVSRKNLELLKENAAPLLSKHQLFAEAMATSDFPTLLRDGVRAVMFDSFAGVPTTYQDLVDMVPSDRDEELWHELERGGTLPIVNEQQAYPVARFGQLPPKRIRNFKRGEILEITEEMLRFDRTNQIRQWAMDFGAQVAQTRESAFYTIVNTTGNYVQTSATNDIGNNTNATTFGAQGIELAYATLATMKDRASGRYLGITPDTLIVGPRLAFMARQMFLSDTLNLASGAAGAPRYGLGSNNPWKGLIKNIVVSPFLGTGYQWCLMQARRAIKWQVVEDMSILIQDVRAAEAEGYFVYDVVRYRVRDWWGMGMFDDRFAYYSSSNTAPDSTTS